MSSKNTSKIFKTQTIPINSAGQIWNTAACHSHLAVPSQVVRIASVDMLRGNRSRKPSNLRHEAQLQNRNVFDIQKAVKRCWMCMNVCMKSSFDNPYLLLLNVPQILKTTRLILGNFRLSNLIFNWSPFENKLTMKVPFEGITPQE